MMILAILKLVFMVTVTVPGFMISGFFALFAVMFIFVELNIKKSRIWFYFLNTSLGKGLFHCFLFVLCYSSSVTPIWIEILLSVIFAVTAFVLFVVYCFFKNQEGPYIDKLIEQARLHQPPVPASTTNQKEIVPSSPAKPTKAVPPAPAKPKEPTNQV